MPFYGVTQCNDFYEHEKYELILKSSLAHGDDILIILFYLDINIYPNKCVTSQ
jgi:hypothetical protein